MNSNELACGECRAAAPWTLSCIHTWNKTRPYTEPRPEHTNGSCSDPAGKRQNEQSRLIAFALLGGPHQRVVERTPEEWAEFARRISLRWLDTKDHRGRVPRPDSDTACGPLLGGPEFAYLKERGFSRAGEPARKRRETALSDNNTFDRGDSDDSEPKPSWWARIVHPRWKLHATAAPGPREHLFQRPRARRIQEELRTCMRAVRALYASGSRLQQPGVRLKLPTNAGWPKFDPSALSGEARAQWAFDRELDRISARAERYSEELWNSVLADYKATDTYDRYDGSHRGWAPRVGVKRAAKLSAIKAARQRAEARAEAYAFKRGPIERALDELALAVRRVAGIDSRTNRDEYRATLPQRVTAEFAKREPKAYMWLAEADQDGATEIPAYVIKAIRRNSLVEYDPRSLAKDLKAVLKGRPGDGRNLIVALAESHYGFQAARKREKLRKTAT